MSPESPQSDNPNPPDDAAPSDAFPAEELRRAMKAFKKRLKLSRLDAESGLGYGPMTGGSNAGIISIVPPNQYPQAVWDELVRLGRLKYSGQGLYEPVKT